MAVTDAITTLSNFMREELPRVMHESLPLVAPFFKDIVATAVGVRRDESSAIGRTWNVIHLYDAGISGLMKYGDPLGPAMVTDATTGRMASMLNFYSIKSSTPFPNANESPHAGSLKRTLQLHYTTGNFSVPVAWMQADALNATQIKTVARDIKAVGKLRAMVEATGFHALPVSDGSYDVKVLGAISSATASSNVLTVVIAEAYGTIHNFRPGMAIDIVAGDGSALGGNIQSGIAYDATDVRNYTTGNTAADYVNVIIQSVDYIGRTFKCVGIARDTGAIATCTTSNGWVGAAGGKVDPGDYIVMKDCSTYIAGTRPMPTWGLEDWMKSSGRIMGGASTAEALDVDVYPQFKSSVTAINGPLTEDVLNKYVGDYLDAYPGETIDTIITTNGVTQKHLQQYGLYNNRQFYDRQGKSLNVKGGWAEVNYEFNGRVVRWIVDPLCLKNRLYGIRLGDGNIKRYVPPSISSGNDMVSGDSAGMDGEVQFLAPAGGHTGIFMVARGTTGQVLDILEAPFWQYQLIAPINPKGIKLTSLTEA